MRAMPERIPLTPRARKLADHSAHREAGFSLVELLVSLLVLVLVLAAAYTVFEFQSRLAQVQTQVAEMQQSQRIGQYQMMREARMAGRGGLDWRSAVEVRNNVGLDGTPREVAQGFGNSPVAVEGSDILTVRGVFTRPLYQLNIQDPSTYIVDRDAGTGTIVINRITPSGIPQDLGPLNEILNDDGGLQPEAIVVASAHEDGIYAVVELTGGVPGDEQVTLNFAFEGGTHTQEYTALNPGGVFPEGMEATAGMIGVLEEYRYYIREVEEQGQRLVPRLSRAQMFPGTEVPYRNSLANAQVDISDNVFDLQVALGIDIDPLDPAVDSDGVVREDDWLFSDPGHDPTQEPWSNPGNRLGYVRLNTLARTPQPHFGYEAPLLTSIEDRVYEEDHNDVEDRRHRRRHMQTIVELRNL